MDLLLPWGRLVALCAAVLAGRQRHGRAVSARAAAARDARAGGEGGLVMTQRRSCLARRCWPLACRWRAHDALVRRGRALALPARPRRAPGAPHRVVVRHRRAAATPAGAALRLPDHLLPLAAPGWPQAASRFARAPAAVRARGADRPGRAPPAARPAHRALERRRARAAGARPRWTTPTCTSATGAAARDAGDEPLPRRAWPTAMRLRLRPGAARATQPLLLQGDAGFSRKGPDAAQASHYYSEPQLAVQRHAAARRPARRGARPRPGSTTSGATR